jgi:hypothetical protein
MSRAGYIYTTDDFYCDVPDCHSKASSHMNCPRGWLIVSGKTKMAGFPDTREDGSVKLSKSSSELHLCTKCKKRSREELHKVGFDILGGTCTWEVHRASSITAPLRLIFRGSRQEAEKKFDKAVSYYRRGPVLLVQPDGVVAKEA